MTFGTLEEKGVLCCMLNRACSGRRTDAGLQIAPTGKKTRAISKKKKNTYSAMQNVT